MSVDWFSFADVDARRTFGAWFGDADCGGVFLWRPGDPVAFTADLVSSELARSEPWRWSRAPAYSMADALGFAREIAALERSAYLERGKTGREASRPEAIDRARAWLAAQPASVAGEDGDRTLARAAVTLVRGFCLEPDGWASILLEEYDRRSEPPWGEAKRRRVLVWAEKFGRMPWGDLLRQPLLRGRGAGRGGP